MGLNQFSEQSSFEDSIKQLIAGIARLLVDDAETVELNVKSGEGSSTFCLTVASRDLAVIIGPKGMTARAIRTLLAAIGTKFNHRLSIEIGDGTEAQ